MAKRSDKWFFSAVAIVAAALLLVTGSLAFDYTEPTPAATFTVSAVANTEEMAIIKMLHVNGTTTFTQTLPVSDGWLYKVVTVPHTSGTTVLQDNWDVAIKDAQGVDIMGGGANNRDQTTAEQAFPLQGTDQHDPVWFGTGMTFEVTGNNVGSVESATYLYILKRAP